ncbi:MAG TPA: hypothetical protein VFW64_12245 [Pseudonocardiaceae bacterium]|nr:hypothetical protein [Pseudonocardiaceae bacterium]
MTAVVSTVPGAVAALKARMDTVAAANPALNVSTHVGAIPKSVNNNFLGIGDIETGDLLATYVQDIAGVPAYANVRSEQYGIRCVIRTWTGSGGEAGEPAARLSEAFGLLDGVNQLLCADLVTGPAADALAAILTPSGSWYLGEVAAPAAGPLGGGGWGCVLSFTVEVINVRLGAVNP